ncbi:hypothetical protein ACLKA6_000737 [Drosophila palustris]
MDRRPNGKMSASSAVKIRRTTPSRGVSRNITGTMQKGKEDVQKLYTIAETSGQRIGLWSAAAALQMRPYASGAAAVATLMACELANLTAADAVAVAAAAAVAPAGDDHWDDDGFLMPRRGTRSQLIASWTPVHEELDDAATPRHCHDAGNWTLDVDVDVKDVGRLLLLLLLLIQMPPGEDPSAVKTAF